MDRKFLIRCGASLSVLMIASAAYAQQRTFDVPAGLAVKTIPEFARQAGIQIIAPADQLDGVVTPPVTGARDARAALKVLIAATHLEIASDDGAVISLHNAKRVAKADAPAAPAARPNNAVASGTVEEVVVTGSRVIANGNESPTPVTVVTTEEMLKASPAGVVQGLNNLPGLLGSINTTSNVNTGGYNTLNLRGVGTTRGLVLYDGHRIGPTRAGGAVDVDVIPQMLLKRVEVVTGGASAVYGSDAVSGVVNFITDAKFDGLKINIQDGISDYGDDTKLSLGVAYGQDIFGGSGHFEASYEFRDYPGIKNRLDRSFFNPIWTEQGAAVGGGTVGSAANPYKLTQGAVIATASFGGQINSGPLSGLNFTQNGVLSPFNHGTPTGTSGVEVGGDGAYFVGSTIGSAQRIHQAFSRFDYDFSDSVHGYVQGVASQFQQGYTQQNLFLNKTIIGYNNAYLTSVQPQYQAMIAAQLKANPLGSFTYSKMDTVIPDYQFVANEYYYMAAAGISGSIDAYDWSVDYDHTISSEHLRNNHNINAGRLYAAMNAVANPANGQIVCNAALANPSVYGSCVPLNLFGPTSESQAAVAYIEQVTESDQRYTTDNVSGTIKGAPLSLPAGPVNMALTGEWRRLTYEIASTAQPTDPVNCTGIQFNCSSTVAPYTGTVVTALNRVSQSVAEVAFETDVPVLAGLSFAQALNINGAVRYTTYNTSGSVWTWKLGFDWKIDDEFTLRATRSRDIRAPNLTDLDAPPTFTQRNYSDIHTNSSGLIPSISQGNPNLKPEEADTSTGGVVWKPEFLSGFSLALDAYRIYINKAIVNIDAFQPASQQNCEASGGTSPICALYTRPFPFSNTTPANFPTQLHGESLNVASLDTYGVDLEANYATMLFERALSLRALFNWQPHLVYNNGPNGIVDVGGAADGIGGLPPIPATKLVFSAAYDITDDWSFRLQERWRGELRQNGSVGLFFADGMVPSIAYTDITINTNVNEWLSAFLNIQNLFNTSPPPWASAGGSVQPNYLGGYPQGDDIEGRFFTLGVHLRL
jgi:outer membrane receptor protein involved in Fe transport